jgi:hypothetical protein
VGRSPRPRAPRGLCGRPALHPDDQGPARRLSRVGDARGRAGGGSGGHGGDAPGSGRPLLGASSPTRARTPTPAPSTRAGASRARSGRGSIGRCARDSATRRSSTG